MMKLNKYGLVNDLISVFESYPPMQKFYNKDSDVLEIKPHEIEDFINDLGKIFCHLIESNTFIDDDCANQPEEDLDEEIGL